MPTVTGVLERIGLFPVKSVAGLAPAQATVTGEGLLHDRGFVVVGADGAVLTAKTAPGLRELVLGGDPAAPTVTSTTGRDPQEVLGGPVALRAADGGARQVAPVHVVSLGQRSAPDAGDSSRANLVLAFGPDEPAPEAFVGARLEVGGVELVLEHRPRHCAGVFASVLVPGTVRVGDAVRLTVGAGGPG